MSSNNFENIQDSVELNIPFHKNCPEYVQYTKNIRQIELETHTVIKLLQIVRISGKIKNIKEADKRVSQLSVNFARNENQDGLINMVHAVQSKMQDIENSYVQKIQELTNALANNKLEIEAINTKMLENVQQEGFKCKEVFQSEMSNVQAEMQEMKNSFDQKIQEMTSAISNNKLEIEASNTKGQENVQNEKCDLQDSTDKDIMSDMELENFCKSEEYVNCYKYLGAHAIHTACEFGRLDVVKKLIKNGVDVNIKDNYNWSPLMCASRKGHKAILEYLISKNADLNIKSKYNGTALSLAIGSNKDEIIKILKNHGATT